MGLHQIKGSDAKRKMSDKDIKMHKIVHRVIRVLMDNRIVVPDEMTGELNEAVRKGLE